MSRTTFAIRGTLSTLCLLLTSCWISQISECRTILQDPSHFASSFPESPESRLISQLLEEDDEIANERDEIENGEFPVSGEIQQKLLQNKKDGRNSAPVKLPAYLETQFGGIGVLEGKDGNGEDKPLARVWLPVEIREGAEGVELENKKQARKSSLSIIFQQTQTLGDFIQAEIVLTGKQPDPIDPFDMDSDLNANPFHPMNPGGLRLQATVKSLELQKHGENYTLSSKIQPSPVLLDPSQPQPFYILDITQGLRNALSTSQTFQHPRKISVQIQLFPGESSASVPEDPEELLLQLFDLQVERPFIVFSYTNSSSQPPHDKMPKIPVINRKRRSVTSQTSGNVTALTPNVTLNATTPTQVPSHLCHREVWNVDGHDDIEWYDLIQPRRLELGFCAGSCPFPLQSDHYNYTLHSFFKDRHRLLKIFNVPKNFPKSCCVPVSYKPIRAWIMEEENTFSMRVFHDVAVDSCGCR